jgi:hypothetical protein
MVIPSVSMTTGCPVAGSTTVNFSVTDDLKSGSTPLLYRGDLKLIEITLASPSVLIMGLFESYSTDDSSIVTSRASGAPALLEPTLRNRIEAGTPASGPTPPRLLHA